MYDKCFLILSTFTDIRIPLTYLKDHYKEIDIRFFLSSILKFIMINSFHAIHTLKQIEQLDSGKVYHVMVLSVIKQAEIPKKRPLY